jgi:PTS system maltose and glucose-specific IIC component
LQGRDAVTGEDIIMKKNRAMDFFSALGRSLLMPIAALAACGIVLGLTSALMKAQVQVGCSIFTAGAYLFHYFYFK